MPVYSMTGFASAQCAWNSSTVYLEVRSVNGRFLDLSLRLPEELRACEPLLRQDISKVLKRGKVDVRLVCETPQVQTVVAPDAALLGQLAGVEASVLAKFPNATRLSVADILRLSLQQIAPQAASPLAKDGAAGGDFAFLQPLLAQALAGLQEARASEGARLMAVLQAAIAQLRALMLRAQPLVPQLVQAQQARFVERFQAALLSATGTQACGQSALSTEQMQERALSEAASYALRIDVAEELARLQAHLDEIEALLHKGGELGKRLDFLIQELHREANTLGSKSALLELSRISVDMKVLIEQMREQIQNIE